MKNRKKKGKRQFGENLAQSEDLNTCYLMNGNGWFIFGWFEVVSKLLPFLSLHNWSSTRDYDGDVDLIR